ncbi:MAG: deoxyguanosinetriphosphate triphosphohydrolase, partial [Gammaproteobacteria bacterium]
IGCQVIDLVETSASRLAGVAPADSQAVRGHGEPLISFSEIMRENNLELKRFLRARLYRHYRVHRMTSKAARTLTALFNAFLEDTRLLPDDAYRHVQQLEAANGDSGRARAVADYIAGMTDRFAIAEYDRVFNPAI